jgi:hypothetical protein
MIITWTRVVVGCRAGLTSKAGCTYWSGRTSKADRTCWFGRACPVWPGDSLFISKCVPTYKISNTTLGTLLVLKTCMKLVMYPPRFRDFDGRKLVVRTVNKLPQAKRLLVLEQSLDLASKDHGLHWCYHSTSSYAQFCTLLVVWKGWYERNLAMFYLRGL